MTPPNTPGNTGSSAGGTSFARLAAFSKSALSEAWVGAAFLIGSFLVAQILVVAMHVQTTRMWADISEVQLARDLYREFYDREKNYLHVANAIEGCQKLYKGDGGKFSHLELNEYLGFFSDLGVFRDKGLLSDELIGHFFGAFIIEAYKYPELQSYIARIRKNFEQPEAFEDFDKIARAVESEPEFARLAQFTKTMCAEKEEGN